MAKRNKESNAERVLRQIQEAVEGLQELASKTHGDQEGLFRAAIRTLQAAQFIVRQGAAIDPEKPEHDLRAIVPEIVCELAKIRVVELLRAGRATLLVVSPTRNS